MILSFRIEWISWQINHFSHSYSHLPSFVTVISSIDIMWSRRLGTTPLRISAAKLTFKPAMWIHIWIGWNGIELWIKFELELEFAVFYLSWALIQSKSAESFCSVRLMLVRCRTRADDCPDHSRIIWLKTTIWHRHALALTHSLICQQMTAFDGIHNSRSNKFNNPMESALKKFQN